MSTLRTLVFAAALIVHTPLWAGQSCSEGTVDPVELGNALELAEKTRKSLLSNGTKVALIARVGQDLSKYHLRYSHLGVAYEDAPGHFTVLHELNECATAKSGLYQEGLGNFFLDDVFKFEVLVLTPPQQVQQAFIDAIQRGSGSKVHHPEYSMLSSPFSDNYQNSNQWVLELFVHVMNPQLPIERKLIQSKLKQSGFKPGFIAVNPLERVGGALFRANIAFSDHPLSDRLKGEYGTVTVESFATYLMAQHPNTKSEVLTL